MSNYKFFHTNNATRTYHVGGSRIQFEISGRNGSVWEGILTTNDVAVIEGLQTLASEGSAPVKEITEERYADLKKNSAMTTENRKIYQINQPAFNQPDHQVDARRVVVETAPVTNQPQPEPEKTLDDLVSTGAVSGSDPEVQAPRSSRRKRK